MVFIKTLWDDVLLKLDVDTTCTTLPALKQEIGKKWVILPMIQQLYLGLDYGLDYQEIIRNPSMRMRDYFDEDGNDLSISQLGVKPCSTLLLLGPVLKPASFFESDDAVVIADAVVMACRQLKKAAELMMEQEFNSVMMNNRILKMA